MSHVVAGLRRLSVLLSIILVIQFSLIPAFTFAAGPTGPTGPQGPTGPTGQGGRAGYFEQYGNPSAGDTVSAENNETGSDSTNTNDTATNSSTDATVENTGTVDNVLNADLVTGQNTVQTNTNAGPVTTGNISGNIDYVNAVNSNLGEGSSYGSQVLNGNGDVNINPSTNRTSLANSNTGNGSTNNNTTDTYSALNLLNSNDAYVNNNLVVNADTGNNLLQGNTNLDDVTTGDINLAMNILNLLNVNATLAMIDVYNIFGDLNGNINIGNSSTGTESTNFNGVNSANDTSIKVKNNADIDNGVTVNANTGQNDVKNNTGTGSLTTGGINIEGAITNIANVSNPMIYIVNVFGKITKSILDSILAPEGSTLVINEINDETGENSDNVNDINQDEKVDLTQINNGKAKNNIIINANTGKNNINSNTAVGNIKTGSIKVLANVANIVNTSVDKLTIGIINIFGNWNPKGKKTTPVAKTTETNPTLAQVPSNGDESHGTVGEESAKSSKGSSSPQSLIERIVNKAPGHSGSTDSNAVTNELSEVLPEASENVIVQSFSTGTETAKTVSKQLLYLVFAGGLLLIIWAATELMTKRVKKNAR